MSVSKSSWLDRKLRLAKQCVEGPLFRENAEHIHEDVRAMFDEAMGRRRFSEAAFVERCKRMLNILVKLKPFLEGTRLEAAGAFEDTLLTYVVSEKK